MTETVLKQTFKLKGRLYTLTVLLLLDVDADCFAHQLDDIIKKAPKMFESAPVVLDLSQLKVKRVDFNSLRQCLLSRQLIPVGVQGVSMNLAQEARQEGLAVFGASSQADKDIELKPAKTPTKSNEAQQTKLITHPVRSGQQIYAKGGDLIVAATVSRGAEVLADGNIHVYGALRGRALAGIQGNTRARIFCQELDAELLSIAGIYVLNEVIKQQVPGPKQVSINKEHIVIEGL